MSLHALLQAIEDILQRFGTDYIIAFEMKWYIKIYVHQLRGRMAVYARMVANITVNDCRDATLSLLVGALQR